jgi:hypothetical protein
MSKVSVSLFSLLYIYLMFSPGRLTASSGLSIFGGLLRLTILHRTFSTITACKTCSPSKPEQSRYAVNHSKPDSHIRLCKSGGNEENSSFPILHFISPGFFFVRARIYSLCEPVFHKNIDNTSVKCSTYGTP